MSDIIKTQRSLAIKAKYQSWHQFDHLYRLICREDWVKDALNTILSGLKFTSEERVHLHHLDGNHNNWQRDNLVAIHESCHDYLHMSKSKS